MRRESQRGTGLPTATLTSDEVVRKMLVDRLITDRKPYVSIASKAYKASQEQPESGVNLKLYKE